MLRKTMVSSLSIKMKWALVLLSISFLIIVPISVLTSCASPASNAEIAQTNIDDDVSSLPAPTATSTLADWDLSPDFTGIDVMNGEVISLSQFQESTVLLNFVNYGCSQRLSRIVSEQLATIRTLTEQRSDFVPISVFCGCCVPEVLREYAEQNDLTWPWILDTGNSIVRLYYDYLIDFGYPTLVLIDQDQRVREVAGYTDLAALNDMIEGL